MSVWDSVIGQEQVVSRLRKIACADASKIAQSWLICGAAGFGSAQVARAFAAALESPDHGEGSDEISGESELSKTCNSDSSCCCPKETTVLLMRCQLSTFSRFPHKR